jgi:ring-1,2-phenylacetyl-CoA epoxidase subunit PaaB
MSNEYPGTRADGSSHDPRMTRLGILSPESAADGFTPEEELSQWQTYEVFHQKARGDQHAHVGSVHAANPEMALLFAKEQFARRMQCVNLWVVRTTDVFMTEYGDSDMFDPATDKSYREAYAYKTRELISAYKKTNAATGAESAPPSSAPTTVASTTGDATRKPRIILGKKKTS